MSSSRPSSRLSPRAPLLAASIALATALSGCGDEPAPLGAGCEEASDCGSGYCADGVCCDAACDGACEACTAAVTGLDDGLCGPAPATTVCRTSAGSCDVAEHCDGTATSCPADVLLDTTTVCRPSGGDCDVDESCDGTSPVCPTDSFVAVNTICRDAYGVCDVQEVCTGAGAACPADQRLDTTTVCRASAGDCDPEERCGGEVDCPVDALDAAGTSCRASLGACDAEEVCSGSSPACPAPTSQVGTAVAACAPYLCTADPACPTSCTSSAQCAPGHACSNSTCVPSKRVFITSTTYTAALGGPSGADALCQARADAAGLGGSFRAWVSSLFTSPSTRFTHFAGPYARLDGIVVADSWADLTDGSIDAIIDRTEFGAQLTYRFVWSQTYANGTSQSTMWRCGDMTDGSSASEGGVGLSAYTDNTWSTAGQHTCNRMWHLYCFEQ